MGSDDSDDDLDVRIDVDPPTDPAAVGPGRRQQDTLVAEVPQRMTSPETRFLEHVSIELPRPAEIGDQDLLPDLPLTRSTSETTRTPRERMVRRLVYASAVAFFMLIIGVSVYELIHLEPEDEATTVSGEKVKSPPPPPPLPSERPGSKLSELLPDRGKDVPALLDVEVAQVFSEDRVESMTLGDGVVLNDKVTLINLWATWCQPCKDELPGFRDMFAAKRAEWGDTVRFLPILDDSKDRIWAYQEYAHMMPESAPFIVDSLQGRVIAALQAADLLPEDNGLPITALLDCRRHVRLIHKVALNPTSFAELQTTLEILRTELGTDFCKQQSRKPARPRTVVPAEVTKAPPPAKCGNRNCEAPQETISNCCDCLAPTCSEKNRRCEQPIGKPPRCVKTAGGLKQ